MEIEKREAGDRTAVLALVGRLNMQSAANLRSSIGTTVDGGRPQVVVDLSQTDFIDSSGLGALVAGLKKARQAAGDLRIAGANEQARTVLGLTNLDRVLRPYGDVEEALDGW
jgi:anti-sigma B factor antagonist